MIPAWILAEDGAFICGDRASGVTSYCEPTSIFAEAAARATLAGVPSVARLALDILKGERDRRVGSGLEAKFDAGNWAKINESERQRRHSPLGRYAVEICDLNGGVMRSFDLPIAPDMVIWRQHWIPGADIPPDLADDHAANIIWYGLNEGRWARDENGLAIEASEQLTDENCEPVAIWRARHVKAAA
ncbi:hypothetical protein SAMN06265338_12614 [Rhodoblastus acidophilus]|uniref:Uncharacterized protein n=1 Tax=Rhodoblastus acidophilus TaxID=1074 RepID=A0A212SCS6_RHOAC|nr:hypothetical protein [Rhodoblastus acidophilus]PPQ35582.1 hypothetical protein CKO16_20275 [Rhodoblastus acidophilus]RAI16993.1 hypothetical protein CH337_18455 [Rhodoblastus acidophilus]SNB83365.1 hypothetical protein SAMN06265338_12614 [Rhodoblastus acidophilus]